MMIDTRDKILVWNPTAEALFDIPVSGAVNRKFRDLDVSYRVEGLARAWKMSRPATRQPDGERHLQPALR